MQSNEIAIELRALKDSDKDYEKIEKVLRDLFKTEIYLPLVRIIGAPARVLKNEADSLLKAIKDGRIEFYRGKFKGRFNASISKELRAIGAQWNRTTGTFKLPQSSLPIEVLNAISASHTNFQAKIAGIDRTLSQILPEEVADKLQISKIFDQTLWKTEKDFRGSLRNITVSPTLSEQSRAVISDEWQNNMKLFIKDWTKKEIANLRKGVQASIFAGNRNEAIEKLILDSHDVSINKAKFLARQETRLLLTKFKQTRYQEAGVNEYKWGISNNPIQSKNGPPHPGFVRHDHGVLEGKIFKWDNPPVTNTLTGARNNPGQDYNCRCFAIPIVKFKKEK